MIKVLLVEDEAAVASFIQRGLSENGFEVSVAMDGFQGLQMGTEHQFDLIILDIMLPIINGLEVCKQLRLKKVMTPILMLTALGTTENIVTGLDTGADDYLTKPFKFSELEARARVLTRRSLLQTKHEQKNSLSLADLEMDLNGKTVNRAQKFIQLTATEFRLLEFMLMNKNKVVSRMEMLEHVWGIDFNMGTNVVDVYVNYLRKKIDREFDHKLIHTVVGMGYIMKENA